MLVKSQVVTVNKAGVPSMKFRDIYFSREDHFSVGMEEESGTYYVSIPVSNQLVDYEEYYRIEKDVFEKHRDNPRDLKYIADEARERLRDKDLLIEPGSGRGAPC